MPVRARRRHPVTPRVSRIAVREQRRDACRLLGGGGWLGWGNRNGGGFVCTCREVPGDRGYQQDCRSEAEPQSLRRLARRLRCRGFDCRGRWRRRVLCVFNVVTAERCLEEQANALFGNWAM
jgi:hypothetical protein